MSAGGARAVGQLREVLIHPSILPFILPAPRSQLASPLVGPYEVIKLAVALTSGEGRSNSTPADDEDSDAIIERILVVIANVESGIEEAALLSSAFRGQIGLINRSQLANSPTSHSIPAHRGPVCADRRRRPYLR